MSTKIYLNLHLISSLIYTWHSCHAQFITDIWRFCLFIILSIRTNQRYWSILIMYLLILKLLLILNDNLLVLKHIYMLIVGTIWSNMDSYLTIKSYIILINIHCKNKLITKEALRQFKPFFFQLPNNLGAYFVFPKFVTGNNQLPHGMVILSHGFQPNRVGVVRPYTAVSFRQVVGLNMLV